MAEANTMTRKKILNCLITLGGNMKKSLLITLLLTITPFFSTVYANDFLAKDLLMQLAESNDPSYYMLKENRHYLNSDRISVSNDGLLLHTDYFGPILLRSLFQDNSGVYTTGAFAIYRCNGCGRNYNSPPSECGSCGSTSFSVVDLLPD